MVIKRSKKPDLPKKEIKVVDKKHTKSEKKKELTFLEEIRIKETKEKEKKKKAEQDAKEERARMESIIFPYLDRLDEQLQEKNSYRFWAFVDRLPFKKIKDVTKRDLENTFSQNPDKYKGRKIAKFSMITYHRNKGSDFKKWGIGIGASINIFIIGKDVKFTKDAWACNFRWELKDFKITKFSFKLIEKMAKAIAESDLECTTLTGISISHILKELEKRGYDFSDVLNPLAGV